MEINGPHGDTQLGWQTPGWRPGRRAAAGWPCFSVGPSHAPSTRTPAGGCTWAPRHTRSRRSNGFVAGHATEDCTASKGQKPLSRRCSLGAQATGSIRLARTRTLGSALPRPVATAVNPPIDRSIRRLVAPHGETQTQFHHTSSRRADASPERVHTAPTRRHEQQREGLADGVGAAREPRRLVTHSASFRNFPRILGVRMAAPFRGSGITGEGGKMALASVPFLPWSDGRECRRLGSFVEVCTYNMCALYTNTFN